LIWRTKNLKRDNVDMKNVAAYGGKDEIFFGKAKTKGEGKSTVTAEQNIRRWERTAHDRLAKSESKN
jgi:hypothetical protein